MSIVDRAKNILLSPKTEWPAIAAEPATVGSVFTYAAILALLPLIGSILFTGLLGLGGFGMGMLGMIVTLALVGYALSLGLLYVVALIVDAIAPSFDGQKHFIQSLKLIVYSATPSWVAGAISGIPVLGFLAMIAGIAFAVYLIYLGSGPLKAIPDAKQSGFTVVTVLIYIVLNVVLVAIITGIVMSAFLGAAGIGALAGSGI